MNVLPLLWLLCSSSLVLLAAGEQNATVASVGAANPQTAQSNSSTAAPLVVNVMNATVSAQAAVPGQVHIIEKTQVKSTNSTELAKEHEKDMNKTSTIPPDNTAKTRKRTDPVQLKPTIATAAPTSAAPAAPNGTITKAAAATATAKPATGNIVAEGISISDVKKVNSSSTTSGNSSSTSTTPSTTTTTTKTTTTTTTTTTPRPTKPAVVYSMDTHSEWEKEQEDKQKSPAAPSLAASSEPLPVLASTQPEPAAPMVQELTGNLADRRGNDYIVPIVTVLLTVPLAIGVVTIMYRRFRELWSTRHYRRMDFLVDGMYND
ncbi:integumentary mucin C.1 [Drosophila madeirensis]